MPQIFTAADVTSAFGAPAEYLGTGGFGETWRLGDQAVKIIHQGETRVGREVEGLGRVTHQNVVRLLKSEIVEVAGEPRETLLFEYIPGGDMDLTLKKGNLLPAESVGTFLTALLNGINALHQASVLHRDLKPGNVALKGGNWDHPVILDLGLARLLDMSSITVYPAWMGTLIYMAPEQIEGRRVRKAADLFSAAVLTRQAITGQHPFHSQIPDPQDAAAYLTRIHAGPIALPSTISSPLRALLDRMVSTAEHERGTTRSCLRDLEEIQ